MEHTREYTWDMETLREEVVHAVSSMAARSMSPDGNSMYDTMRVKDRDAYEVDAALLRAFASFEARLTDICEVVHEESPYEVVLGLYLPDATGDEEVMRTDIERFVVAAACASWLETRHAEMAKVEAGRAQDLITSIARRAKTRSAPSRT